MIAFVSECSCGQVCQIFTVVKSKYRLFLLKQYEIPLHAVQDAGYNSDVSGSPKREPAPTRKFA